MIEGSWGVLVLKGLKVSLVQSHSSYNAPWANRKECEVWLFLEFRMLRQFIDMLNEVARPDTPVPTSAETTDFCHWVL